MTESMVAMLRTQKGRLLKKDIHIYACRIHEQKSDSLLCHRHDFFTIEHIIEGECVQYINGKEYHCTQGSIFLLSPFDEHRYVISDSAVIDFICFGDDIVFPEVWELLDIDQAPYTAHIDNEVFELMKSDAKMLIDEIENCKSLFQVSAKAIVNKMLVTVLRSASEMCAQSHSKKADLREAMSYIRYHFREPLTLEGISEIFHVSPSHFCKYFKKNTYMTFKEYLTALRLDYAMRLIKTTDKSISQICAESGFSSPSYFSKMFYRRFGKNPSQIR